MRRNRSQILLVEVGIAGFVYVIANIDDSLLKITLGLFHTAAMIYQLLRGRSNTEVGVPMVVPHPRNGAPVSHPVPNLTLQ